MTIFLKKTMKDFRINANMSIALRVDLREMIMFKILSVSSNIYLNIIFFIF